MPLDPEVKQWLDNMYSGPLTPLDQLTPQQARQQMVASTKLLDPGPSLESVEDLAAEGPADAIPIRIYRPDKTKKLPVVMYFHGGGWVVGSLDTHDAYCRELASRSHAVVISVDYRLAPEHLFPAAFEDSYAATRWVAANADELNVDRSRIAVAGDSSGGNLAAAVALAARDRNGPKLCFQLLIYPIVDHNVDTPSYLENAEGFHLTRASMIWFWDQYAPNVADRSNPYASPLLTEDLSGLPPALVCTAQYDPLCDEGRAYAEKLKQAGVNVTLSRYDGMIHGFVRQVAAMSRSRDALDDFSSALRSVFLESTDLLSRGAKK